MKKLFCLIVIAFSITQIPTFPPYRLADDGPFFPPDPYENCQNQECSGPIENPQEPCAPPSPQCQ